jgi:ferric-dicitrate binding protein FerR (iron transport regulator)
MTDRAGDIVMLLKKHIANELTEVEKNQLKGWINESEENQKVFDEMTHEDSLQKAMRDYFEFKDAHDDKQDSPVVDLYSSNRGSGWLKIAAAAVIVLVLGISYYVYTIKRTDQTAVVTNAGIKKTPQDIAPGGNKAVLTLADGSTIILDSAKDGVIAEQDKTIVRKKQNGELEYNSQHTTNSSLTWNIVTTPRGGQYQLTLPDGSKVWLNAASSIKFPVSFTGATRTVQLTGEAYFEVAHVSLPGSKERMPFEVQVNNGMKVQVLGTHFNIMAYEEEKEAKTTLIQGKVKVIKEASNSATTSVLLQPGQQAQLSNSDLRVQKDADVAEAVAWKEGKFKFVHTDLKAVMRNLARWYDVQIEYAPNVPDKFFTGEISRRLNASEVLSVIEFAGVHCKIEGKKIKVLP